MKIHTYEYFTSLGIGKDVDSQEHSMYREGRAMRDAIESDFLSSGHILEDNSRLADWIFILAPEPDPLTSILYHFLEEGSRVLLSKLPAIELTSDKLRLCHHWMNHEVSTPDTREFIHRWPGNYPFIIKPSNGAGSTDIRLISNHEEWSWAMENRRSEWIAQQYVRGRAASIAFLLSSRQTIPLCPTYQMISNDGHFHYLGGQLPIACHLEARAIALGRQAVDCIPGLRGYVGVDLILGDAADGSEDYAIEINPRLTTSYVGLRVLADFNIAQAMIDVVEGRPVDYIKWKPGRVHFWPDGRVEYDPTPGAVFE